MFLYGGYGQIEGARPRGRPKKNGLITFKKIFQLWVSQ